MSTSPRSARSTLRAIDRLKKAANLEATKKAEKAKDADMSAYKRLRQSGLQPKTINGSAHLEKHAETKSEIQAGRLYSSDASRKESERLMNSIEAV